MQKNTIKNVIKKKIEDWLSSIDDTVLRHELEKSLLVSGGCITSMFLNEEVNDYDIYIQDKAILLKVVNYYTKELQTSNQVEIMDGAKAALLIKTYEDKGGDIGGHNQYAAALRNLKEDRVRIYIQGGGEGIKLEPKLKEGTTEPKKYQPIFISGNAISLSDKIQIVNRFHGTPEQIHKTFDFIHATNYYTTTTGLVTNLAAVESILTKQLRYQGSEYPVTSIIRVKKFIRKNWKINAGDLLKIMFQISMLDLSDTDVLEEQLIGVDVAYFGALVKALREHTERNPDFKPTSEYMNEMIDRIFNLSEDE